MRDPAKRERLLIGGRIPADGPSGLGEMRAFMDQQVEQTRRMVTRTGIRLQP